MLDFGGAEQRLKLTRPFGLSDEDYKANRYSLTHNIESIVLSSMEVGAGSHRPL